PRRQTARLIALSAFLFLSAYAQAFSPSGLLEIHQINVQQGESALVVGPDGTTLLLDAGKNSKGALIVSYMQSIGLDPADGLDYTIAGHLDADHVGGFDEVIDAGYDVRFENYFNGSDKTSSTIDDYKDATSGTTAGSVTKPMLGEIIQLGNGATLTFVAVDGSVIGSGPVPGATDNENDRSLAVLIEYGDFDYIWASDLGGGDDDNSCTGRSTSQTNVETPLAQAITPGGAWQMLSNEGVDVLHVNHHGSESSTNSDYMNLLKPELAVIPVGAGQGGTWHHPRKDILEEVLQAKASCITAPSVELVLQTEEGDPTGGETSFKGYAVGDIKVSTDGVTNYLVEATGNVSQGPDERDDADLPLVMPLDESGTGGNTVPVVAINSPADGSSFEEYDTINFLASASDAEDGDLSSSISWSSDLDGYLGTGDDIFAMLSIGSHVITASVTDSASFVGSETIGVIINSGPNTVYLSEVFYDAPDSDNGFEWVELYNSGAYPVDLAAYSLGSGGTDYTTSKLQLSGTIEPGATFVVGGPKSKSKNSDPDYDLEDDFSPDLQNSGSTADGMALFNVPASAITASTVPVDAVIYGDSNNNDLIDETGSAGGPDVGDAPAGSSVERIDLAGSWQIQSEPTPNNTPF
ncbi:MAG: hypothetical protein HKP32_02485, partial [Woeseia sp.]|nr:hypothetical protein [Woeseia sp.]